jgi:hypothetical protein
MTPDCLCILEANPAWTEAVSGQQQGAKPMPEIFSFKVRAGRSLTHTTDLVLTPDRVKLGDRELPAAQVDWIRLRGYTVSHTGIKAGTTMLMELGNSDTSLRICLNDMFYSTKHTNHFPEIALTALRFYGPRIIREMVATLASGGSLNVGKFRFTASRVEIPQRKYLFFAAEPVAVPWAQAKCYAGISLDSGIASNPLDTWRLSIGNGSVGYATDFWTPNACLVKPLVQFMQSHPEVSGGPWFAAKNSQKLGPFSWSQFQQMAAAGILQDSDRVMQEGTEQWVAAASIPGLFPGT